MTSVIIHPDIEPGVIDNNMLIKCVLEQGPKGEAGRLFAEEGVHLEDVKILRLEFLNIIRIDHLWMLKSLTKLTLTHNHIEVIENLEALINLTELDVSFNNIEKIENLSYLINIEVLMLNHNKIEIIENLESLEKLLVLSVAGNSITDYKEVIKLRQFKELRSLSFKDNPCCEDPDCMIFVKAALPRVTYIDYIMVTEKERDECIAEYKSFIRQLDEADEITEAARIKKHVYDAQVKFYKLSFVEYLSGPELFKKMFEQDADGTVLLEAGRELKVLFEEYMVYYVQTMQGLVEFGQAQYSVRENEVRMFQEVIDNARNKSLVKCKGLVNEYMKEKEQLLVSISSLEMPTSDGVNFDDVEESLVECNEMFSLLNKKLWDVLMTEEMALYEQCEETRVQFGENVKDLATKMSEVSRAAFTLWRERESQWTIRQGDVLTKMIGLQNSAYDKSSQIAELMGDRDLLMDVISQSADNHMRFIDEREDHIISRINTWQNDIIDKVNWEEVERNRSRVLEISYLLDNEKEEWERLLNDFVMEKSTPDMSALLHNKDSNLS